MEWSDVYEKFTFPHMFCLLSIRSYEARMIMYARALYRSFKVKWIGKVYFPHTFCLLSILSYERA